MKGGVGDADYLAAWDLVLGPIARAYAPQVQPDTCGFCSVAALLDPARQLQLQLLPALQCH
jgi:hypothetical protein